MCIGKIGECYTQSVRSSSCASYSNILLINILQNCLMCETVCFSGVIHMIEIAHFPFGFCSLPTCIALLKTRITQIGTVRPWFRDFRLAPIQLLCGLAMFFIQIWPTYWSYYLNSQRNIYVSVADNAWDYSMPGIWCGSWVSANVGILTMIRFSEIKVYHFVNWYFASIG